RTPGGDCSIRVRHATSLRMVKSERAGVDADHGAAGSAHRLDEMARPARAVAAAAVPQADAAESLGARRARAFEQPEVAANERVFADSERTELARRFARRGAEASDDGAI